MKVITIWVMHDENVVTNEVGKRLAIAIDVESAKHYIVHNFTDGNAKAVSIGKITNGFDGYIVDHFTMSNIIFGFSETPVYDLK